MVSPWFPIKPQVSKFLRYWPCDFPNIGEGLLLVILWTTCDIGPQTTPPPPPTHEKKKHSYIQMNRYPILWHRNWNKKSPKNKKMLELGNLNIVIYYDFNKTPLGTDIGP